MRTNSLLSALGCLAVLQCCTASGPARGWVRALLALRGSFTARHLTIVSTSLLALLAAPSSRAETVFITGANSGIGLEFVKQYAALGWDVIATHRRDETPATLTAVMAEYTTVQSERMDVTSPEEVRALATRLTGTTIDLLINNAGVYQFNGTYDNQNFESLDFEIFDTFARTNIRGPALVTESFIDHVRASDNGKIVSISSSHGAITSPPFVEGALWYAMSKAALNRIMHSLAYALRDEGIVVVVLHPGSVRTERQADLDFPGMIETDFSVMNMIDTITGLTIEDTDQFLLFDGSTQPW